MSNIDTTVSATGSYVVIIDSDNDSTVQKFEVTANGVATPVFTVDEFGNVAASGTLTPSGLADFSARGARTIQQSGAPSGGSDGDIVLDSLNSRIWVKVLGVWRYAALT